MKGEFVTARLAQGRHFRRRRHDETISDAKIMQQAQLQFRANVETSRMRPRPKRAAARVSSAARRPAAGQPRRHARPPGSRGCAHALLGWKHRALIKKAQSAGNGDELCRGGEEGERRSRDDELIAARMMQSKWAQCTFSSYSDTRMARMDSARCTFRSMGECADASSETMLSRLEKKHRFVSVMRAIENG